MRTADVRERLRRLCRQGGGQAEWSRVHKVSAPVVCLFLRNGKEPPPAILAALGLERAPLQYRRKK